MIEKAKLLTSFLSLITIFKRDGKEEPRLISSTPDVSIKKNIITTLESFSWLDESNKVKVYLDFETAGSINDDNITLVTYCMYYNDNNYYYYNFYDYYFL